MQKAWTLSRNKAMRHGSYVKYYNTKPQSDTYLSAVAKLIGEKQ